MKQAVIVTLGCRLNQADSALIADRLANAGYTIVEDGDGVELVVINSCAVTAQAVAKSRQAMARWKRKFPGAEIILTGCAAESDAAGFQRDERIGAVLTNPDKRAILKAPTGRRSLDASIEPFSEHAAGRFPFRHRALVKIQEGCDNFCTYCIVPYVRGPERSRRVGEVLEECRRLVASGVPEIVLTGVNSCAYSADGYDLGKLVREICSLDGDFRVRLSSTEPRMDNLALLADLAESGGKVCRFLHLSLQHGSDAILAKMNRHYRRSEYAAFAAEARRMFPGLHLGTDIIAGFPGETEALFEDSLAFIAEMAFANTHIFTYSKRPGTPAAGFPDQVPPSVARERHRRLADVAEKSAAGFRASQLGMELPVIFEEEKNGLLHGWSDNYLAMQAPAGSAEIGRIVRRTLFS